MDKARLYCEMRKKGISIGGMCEKLNMSRSAFYRKCKGTSEFKRDEIQKIVYFLELDSQVGFFLAGKVA